PMTRTMVTACQRVWLVLGLLIAQVGCSTAPMNTALTELAPASDVELLSTSAYREATIAPNDTAGDLLILLASSGGGKRSAAFSYGVLRGLRDFHISVGGRERRLIDELDTIAGVSGGSFPAAYYGLHRDGLFTDFEKDFLKRDIDAYIW